MSSSLILILTSSQAEAVVNVMRALACVGASFDEIVFPGRHGAEVRSVGGEVLVNDAYCCTEHYPSQVEFAQAYGFVL